MAAVLDSWALIALLRREAAAPAVLEAIADDRPIMSWVNLGEVAYAQARRIGWESASRIVLEHAAAAIRAELPDEELVLAAARWKVGGGLSYADAFAAATAERHDAPLLTGDPELLALAPGIQVIDVRA